MIVTRDHDLFILAISSCNLIHSTPMCLSHVCKCCLFHMYHTVLESEVMRLLYTCSLAGNNSTANTSTLLNACTSCTLARSTGRTYSTPLTVDVRARARSSTRSQLAAKHTCACVCAHCQLTNMRSCALRTRQARRPVRADLQRHKVHVVAAGVDSRTTARHPCTRAVRKQSRHLLGF